MLDCAAIVNPWGHGDASEGRVIPGFGMQATVLPARLHNALTTSEFHLKPGFNARRSAAAVLKLPYRSALSMLT